MKTLTSQEQSDMVAKQLKFLLIPFARNQQELNNMIDRAKHNAKAHVALSKGEAFQCNGNVTC